MDDEMSQEEVEDLVEALFIREHAPYAPDSAPYKLIGQVEHTISGRLVRFVLSHDLLGDREVSLFLSVNDVVGELWEHEVRNLLRLRMLGHPALPQIEDGRFDKSHRVAFIMTAKIGTPLAEEGWPTVREWATTYPVVAFEQFSLLVDALSQLHGTRIVHRNLTLNAIRLTKVEKKPTQATLSLARFELSAMLNNLLHSVNGPDARRKHEEAMRALYHYPPPGISRAQHLAYLAPETYASVLGGVQVRRLDHGSTDVFGLGVLGWELFVDSLTERLPEECATVDEAGPGELPEALADLHTAMRRELNIDTRVPRRLRDTLLAMLDPSPTGRCSAFEAASDMQRSWTAISGALEPEAEVSTPRLLAFMPEKSVSTIHDSRGWTDHPPDTPEGQEELRAFLADELGTAELIHCPRGAKGFVEGDARSLAEAKWALIGAQAVWFCAYLYDEDLMGRRRGTHTDTLVIKYLVDKRFASDLLAVWPRRRIGRFDLVPFRKGQSLIGERKGRPSWADLAEAVTVERSVTNGDDEVQDMLLAFAFFLEYQGVALRARQYPYVKEETDGGAIVLVHDKERDRPWLHGDPLLTAYADPRYRRRAHLGDFAQQLLAENRWAKLSVAEDRNAGKGSGSSAAEPYFSARNTLTVRIDKRLDADSVVVQDPSGLRDLPERGWLRPDSDRGTEVQLRREARGLDSLGRKRGLARILRKPSSIALRGVATPVESDAYELRGRAPEIIADMLRLHPFYALQGPPGTGKSTVISRALRDFLAAEQGARVLVSAQSNDALDELAQKIVEELGPKIEKRSILVLRELSRNKERSDLPADLQRLTADPIAEDLVKHVEMQVEQGCVEARNKDERDLMTRWSRVAQTDMVELAERIKSGADIVLATCSKAGTLTDEVRDPSDMFDWVIIEEAAKAWPTEVVMPLVLGVRWTLVGDYLQLGPHRARDIETFLDSLASHQHERIKLHYGNRDLYLNFVQMFRRFFEGHVPGQPATAALPVNVLDTQFRMHPTIALPFATAFYPATPIENSEGRVELPTDPQAATFLQPDPEIDQVHGVTKPAYLKHAPLVWLDTSRSTGCSDRGFWWNPGEVKLVRGLVCELGLEHGTDPKELSVLTPYRHQKEKLDKDFLKGRVRTVHSSQGSQAKTVIISLVRSGDRGTESRHNIGHTSEPELMNVMLSRARRLLVVVGNLTHYERHGGPDWQTVIRVFRDEGRIVDAETGEIMNGRAAPWETGLADPAAESELGEVL
jgi:serine/threonine protein kinase